MVFRLKSPRALAAGHAHRLVLREYQAHGLGGQAGAGQRWQASRPYQRAGKQCDMGTGASFLSLLSLALTYISSADKGS